MTSYKEYVEAGGKVLASFKITDIRVERGGKHPRFVYQVNEEVHRFGLPRTPSGAPHILHNWIARFKRTLKEQGAELKEKPQTRKQSMVYSAEKWSKETIKIAVSGTPPHQVQFRLTPNMMKIFGSRLPKGALARVDVQGEVTAGIRIKLHPDGAKAVNKYRTVAAMAKAHGLVENYVVAQTIQVEFNESQIKIPPITSGPLITADPKAVSPRQAKVQEHIAPKATKAPKVDPAKAPQPEVEPTPFVKPEPLPIEEKDVTSVNDVVEAWRLFRETWERCPDADLIKIVKEGDDGEYRLTFRI